MYPGVPRFVYGSVSVPFRSSFAVGHTGVRIRQVVSSEAFSGNRAARIFAGHGWGGCVFRICEGTIGKTTKYRLHSFGCSMVKATSGCFGSLPLPTPNLDRMAHEGMRLTRFYSASPVCSPSRAAFLTGRYPARSGIVNVLMPSDKRGLNPSERTIPKILKERGYRTACVGKWHLGCQPGVMPRDHSFDEFYGLPYSNDMDPLPMMRNGEVVQPNAPQAGLTGNFTKQAVDFIQRQEDGPFFLYFAHTAPHVPLVPSDKFRGQSGMGNYGDVVMEMDWSVGEVLKALADKGFEENTLVVFTSDNGPWYQGSAGKLQGRKGSTYEGGVREPFIARFPGKIPPGTTAEGVGSAMDMLPTFANLAGASVSASSLDGIDISPMLTGEKQYMGRDPLLLR